MMLSAAPCLQCGGPKPAGSQQKFCCGSCRSKHWSAHNREKDQASKEAYRKSHMKEVAAWALARYHADPLRKEKTRAIIHAAKLKTPWIRLLYAVRNRANKRGIPFDLTPEWCAENWTGRCALTGMKFTIFNKRGGDMTFAPSIDKISPKLGYVQSNCRFILYSLNNFKGAATDETIRQIARELLSNE